MKAIVFSVLTGDILRAIVSSRPELQCGPGEQWLEGHHDPAACFVKDGRVLQRAAMTLHSGDNWIDALPPGAVVAIEGQRIHAHGARIDLTFTQPGPYAVRVTAPGYRAIDLTLAGGTSAAKDAVLHESSYVARRIAEYPDLREQLDAVWKGGKDADAMRERVLGVKAKYPKPKDSK